MLKQESSNCELDPNLELVNKLSRIIHEKLGRNIYAVDIRGISTLCDYCIIAEGRVDRHVQGIARTVEDELKKEGMVPTKVEGMQEGNWVILDYLNVMVHLLTPAFREKYYLERLWQEGKIVDLNFEN